MKGCLSFVALFFFVFGSVAFAVEEGDNVTFSGQVQFKDKPVNFVEMSSAATPATGSWHLYFTANGLVVEDDNGTARHVGQSGEVVAAANSITADECGKDFYLNDTTEFASTLPALSTVSAGCVMRFIVAAAPASADYTVITGNSKENKIYGSVLVNNTGVAGVDEDTITFVDGTAIIGDFVELRSDGTAWYVNGFGGAAGAITLTQAD